MIDDLIYKTRELKGSDLHLTVGEPPVVRIHGRVSRLAGYHPLTPEYIDQMAKELTRANEIDYNEETLDYDFCYVSSNKLRQRVNIFTQKGARGIALRMLNAEVPTLDQLQLPEILKQIASLPRGLVLVTGPTGSGKTTTLAAMVDYINSTKNHHILTIEDPIEYLHTGKRCIVNQREVNVDVESFAMALRSALREDPDAILVGEMRDLDTISAAITAAETGHLVMGTLHTIGAAKTIDRIIDVFPPHQQQQVRTQLATVLKAVITQNLVPKADETGRVAAFEIMLTNDAVANLIRENKTFQINSVMQTNGKNGMILLDMYLAALVKQGTITMEVALERCVSKEELTRFVTGR